MPPLLVLDTETYLFQPGRMAPKVVCVALRYPDGRRELVRPHDPKVDRALLDCAHGKFTLAGVNLPYDMACLGRTRPDLLPTIFDIYMNFNVADCILAYKLHLLRQGKLSEDGKRRAEESFSLNMMAQIILGRDPMDKGEDGFRMRFGTLDPDPISTWPTRAVAYALDDVEVPYCLLRELGYEAYPDLGRQSAYALPLHLMSVHGLRTSRATVEEIENFWVPAEARYKAEVTKLGVIREDGTKNTKALQEVLRAAWQSTGVPPEQWAFTDTGKKKLEAGEDPTTLPLSASADTLDDLAERADTPELRAYAGLVHAQKMLSTYVSLLWTGTKLPIHMGVDSLKATGRISQFKPSMQTLPRGKKGEPGIREAFVPREGNVILAADLDTAEVRAFGQTLLDTVGWSRIAEGYQRDPRWDPHCLMGAAIEGKGRSYEDALANAKSPEFKEFRNMAKGANFGLPGGMGAQRLIDYVVGYGIKDLTLERAQQIRNLYRQMFPETIIRAKQIEHAMNANGGEFMAKTVRSHRERLCTGSRAYNQARNSDFQPYVADIAKLAGLYLAHAQYVKGVDPRLYGTRSLNMVHDEFNIEAPVESYEEAAGALSECFTRAAKVWCPDVPFRSSTAAMARLQKCDPVYKDGHLEVIP